MKSRVESNLLLEYTPNDLCPKHIKMAERSGLGTSYSILRGIFFLIAARSKQVNGLVSRESVALLTHVFVLATSVPG